MEQRYFEKFDKTLPLLGMGCMRLPCHSKEDGGKINYEKAKEMLDYLYNNGVKYYDTAYFYHEGESELFLGKALAEYPRESYYIADKFPIWNAKEPGDVEKIFNEQLSKVNVEYFDFYLLHCLTKNNWERAKQFGIYEFCAKMKKAGKIKHFGFSFHDTPTVMEQILDDAEWDFAQIMLNYYDYEGTGKNLYSLITNKKLPVIVMEPVRGGSLCTLSDDVADLYKASGSSESNASWAMRFVASHPNVAVALSGVSTMEHCVENTKTYSPLIPMTEKEFDICDKMAKKINSVSLVPCTSCKYCSECPQQIDIPNIFNFYNNYLRFNNKKDFMWNVNQREKEHNLSKCTKCGTCTVKCPQKIDIPEILKKIASVV